MESHSYVSCIKINGVPILPPMITADMKKEIYSYKESAIMVEKRLAALRVANVSNQDIYSGKVRIASGNGYCKKDIEDSTENLESLEYKNNNYSKTNIIDTNNVPVEIFDTSNEDVEKASCFTKDGDIRHKLENQENLIAAIVLNHCANPRESCGTSSTRSAITEVTPEILRPQVPKTLNVIPLTLGDTNCKENKECQTSNLDDARNIPKLVRQGSYVLDTPSPILLAHMQMELASSNCTSCSEYVPTSNTDTARHKVWSATDARIEWEYDAKNTESSSPLTTDKGNIYSNNGGIIYKSDPLRNESPTHLPNHLSARSAHCIQSMLARENTKNNMRMINKDSINANISDENVHELITWEMCNVPPTSNKVSKIAGSSESVSENNNVPMGKNVAETKSDLNVKGTAAKIKSSIASDKLLTVYKKVQEMHKKQMAELMTRQQREQTLLQKEFEKQQLLLLNEIRKTFPEFSVTLLSENVLSPTIKQGTPKYSNNNFGNINNNVQQNVEISTESQMGDKRLHESMKAVPCPLKHISSETNCDNISYPAKHTCSVAGSNTEMCGNNNSEIKKQKTDMGLQLNTSRSYESKLFDSGIGECKRSNVSRELFPLDSKTIHVPVFEKTVYGSKHIKAVNIINAYVRGYLVRRMMQTERVIALKNTYKEALQCMLKLHVDAPLNRSEYNFLHRLQLQCDAASMNIVELFGQKPEKRMQVIAQDREIKQSRIERPSSARSYSFATQRTLARKKLKEMEEYQPTSFVRSCLSRSRCQTWTSDIKERLISSNVLYHSIKRSTSTGTVRKPWR